MKIYSIRIQKFRSIDDATLTVEQVLALVGANNVGKSHILRALNAFFNFEDEKAAFLNRDHAFSLKSRPRVTIIFSDVLGDDGIQPQYIENGRLKILFTYRWDRDSPSYEVFSGAQKHTFDIDNFLQLVSHYRYIYVPVIRNCETAFSTDNGIAYTLLKAVIQQLTANRNNIQPLVDQLYKKVENSAFTVALQRIQRFYPFEDCNSFRLRINNNDLVDSIIRDISLQLIENSQVNGISNCGSGVQSAVYFAISLAIAMNESICYLVGIEEPELNMHPQAQRQLIESLKNTSKYPNTQFLLTTHSPVIIDRLGHTAIALCRKCKGETRDIITMVTQIGSDFWDKYQMQEERYYNFFEYKNSDFFFSKYIIITESPIDCGIFSTLLKKYNIDTDEVGLSFIPADGEKSIKYPYSIAKELEIPFLCVLDRDVFQPYIGENRNSSLDEHGVPQYKPEAKRSDPFCDMINRDDIDRLLDYQIRGKYKDTLDLLDKYSIVMMRYALEVDLIICDQFCQAYCDVLHVEGDNRTSKYLFTEKKKKIKTKEVIEQVLRITTTKNLPMSYRRFIQNVKKMISTQ